MQGQDPFRKKTRSQVIEDDKSASYGHIPSQNNLDNPGNNIDAGDASKLKTNSSRKSNWNRKERVKYLVFLAYYSDLTHWSSDLKSIPTYKALSQFVKTRSPEQCKSFHLSMKRNFRSNQQLIKSLHDQLAVEEGFQKFIDRYDFQIIGFEQQHRILELYGLKQKQYFVEKWKQKCKQSGIPKQKVSNESPPAQQECYNPKINIKQLMNDDNKNKSSKIDLKDEHNEFVFMKQDNNHKSTGNYINSQTNNQNMFGQGHQLGLNFYLPQQDSLNRNKHLQKNNSESFKQNNDNRNNQKIHVSMDQKYLQDCKRMMEANKNNFGQFPGFGNYPQSTFSQMNPMNMHLFQNQMPFSMPPPGGLQYLFPGYNPYSFGGVPNRFPSSNVQNQPGSNGFIRQKQNVNEVNDKRQSQQNLNVSQQMRDQKNKPNNQRRKQLALQCHQHWINWMRGVMQLQRRQQLQGITSNTKFM